VVNPDGVCCKRVSWHAAYHEQSESAAEKLTKRQREQAAHRAAHADRLTAFDHEPERPCEHDPPLSVTAQ
jgi:hypothetical protein